MTAVSGIIRYMYTGHAENLRETDGMKNMGYRLQLLSHRY